MKSYPLKWHGGKQYLAKRIISVIPPHLHYVEPYFGGGAVLLSKPAELIEGHSEVANDINGELTNFWHVLADRYHYPQFQRIVEACPIGREVWRHNSVAQPCGEVDAALAFFVRYRQSRQGLGKDFATLSKNRTRRGMNEQASSWLSAVEGLPEAHERLKRVVIECDDAVKVIKREDGPQTFFYCDPPYLHDTRVTKEDYEHEMTESDHRRLLMLLADNGVDGFPCIDEKPDALRELQQHKMQGKWLLSGYRSVPYDATAELNGWYRFDIQIDCKASGAKEKPKRIECLWANYPLPGGVAC